ncbi:MAG: ABC transporter permease [Oscillospiraceae bacterium]|nr:ABC transporter permease [Oscillospiraceae bacterium]
MAEFFQNIFDENTLRFFAEAPFAVWETLYSTAIATLLAYAIGLPLGVLLVAGENGRIVKVPSAVMAALNTVVNLLRSVPFLILMVIVIPLSRVLLGTSVGTPASIVPLVVAAAPFVARIVEGSLRELDPGVLEAAQAMGCTPWQIVTKVMLPECRPSLLNGLTTSTITILSYGAMAGAIGAGGLGSMALMKGYQRKMQAMLWGSVVLLVILVQIIQSIGTALSVRTDRRINTNQGKKRRNQL